MVSSVADGTRVDSDILGLQTYLAADPKESRTRTIPKGAKAPQAAGVIHTDFEKGFIKAEVISFDDLVEAGSVAEARSRGKARMEGKDYVMRDGDVVEFRHSKVSGRMRPSSFVWPRSRPVGLGLLLIE